MITKQQIQLVNDAINNEGIDYCFRGYSNFSDIDDARFHELRHDYIRAAEALEQYLKKA